MSENSLSSEQAFDMLPYVADIYDKTGFDKYRKDIKKKYAGKKKIDYLDPVVDAGKFILKNSPKAKEEFFTIVAIAENRDVEDVKKQPFMQTLKSIKMIFSDKELVDFFKQA